MRDVADGREQRRIDHGGSDAEQDGPSAEEVEAGGDSDHENFPPPGPTVRRR
jgi:hypothetical protein